jgi:high-affinity iron transporter
MLGALVIVFREVLEAGLIIGIVMAASRGAPGRGVWIAAGVLAGVVGAGIIALFAGAIADAFEGSGQELLNAAVLAGAVLMLMWHNAWMARHGRELAAEMSAVGAAVTAGQRPMTALAVVVGLAVLREGSEVVLFLYGIVATGTSASALLLGGALGVAAGAAFTALTYYGLVGTFSR